MSIGKWAALDVRGWTHLHGRGFTWMPVADNTYCGIFHTNPQSHESMETDRCSIFDN